MNIAYEENPSEQELLVDQAPSAGQNIPPPEAVPVASLAETPPSGRYSELLQTADTWHAKLGIGFLVVGSVGVAIYHRHRDKLAHRRPRL